jgi:phosphatidylglycerophosphate synthase
MEPNEERAPISLGIALALPVPGAAPLEVLAGLSLALRTVLTLQKEGFSRVILVVPEEQPELGVAVVRDARVKVELELVPSSQVSELAAAVDEPFVLGRFDVILDPGIYKALRAMAPDAEALVAQRDGAPVGVFAGSPALLRRFAAASTLDFAQQVTADPSLPSLDVGARWAFRVTTPEGRERAFFQLFEACRKPVDGLVARHINRHISIFISKRIVHTPLTPNMMSVFTFILGLAGAYSASRGGYYPVLLGAFLFQWNSILDGVDGELARVRFQQSKLGQWVDTASDDLSNIAFYIGLTVGARGLAGDQYLVPIGVIGTLAFVLQMIVLYVELIQKGTGDLYAIDWDFDKAPPEGFAEKLLVFFRYALKKDFAILFFLLMAVFGVLPYMLPIIAGGAIGTLIAALKRKLAQ